MTTRKATTVQSLSRSSKTPLWQQLEHELRRRIQLGDFVDKFPSDRELMEDYGVSRHTARHAVSSLGRDGIVQRLRGIGTALNSGRITQSLGNLYSLFQVVEAAGVEQKSIVLTIGPTSDAEIAKRLGLAEYEPLFHLARLRLAAERPIAVDYVWLPGAYTAQLAHLDFSHTALYDELERSGLGRPTAGSERISAVVPNSNVTELLGLNGETGVLELVRQGERSGKVIEWRVTYVRGDEFSLVTDWQRGRRSEMRLEQNELTADLKN